MLIALGAALKTTAMAGDPAPARMERAASARLVVPRIPQASLVPLRVAILLAAAVVCLRAVMPAWRAAVGPPAVAPW